MGVNFRGLLGYVVVARKQKTSKPELVTVTVKPLFEFAIVLTRLNLRPDVLR